MADMWISWYILILYILPFATASQERCDPGVPCNCCADGGLSCSLNSNLWCQGPCIDGYYGIRCIKSCPVECVACHQSFGKTNICYKCIDGRYGQACTDICSNCQSCDRDTGFCIECASGYYGQNCSKTCSQNCLDLRCDFNSGKCDNCEIGFYDDTCSQACLVTCNNSICDRNIGICYECVEGYYGDYCNNTCSNNCLDGICNQLHGICEICIDGTYGVFCESSCPSNCNGALCDRSLGTCINGCTDSHRGDKCEECVIGKYGQRCDQHCSSNCLNDECNRNNGACTSGCESGFSDYQFCCVNNSNCEFCSSPSECKYCKSGYYGQECEQSCPDNCNGSCNKLTGNCEYCVLNYYGQKCENNCSESCLLTDDQMSPCNPVNGNCEFGCISGFYGYMCEYLCSECCNEYCNQQSGKCHSCNFNRFGLFCDNICSHACVRNDDDDVVCNKTTGICLHGCLGGFYGDKCHDNCSSGCHAIACNSSTNGCLKDYTGPFCLAKEDGPHSDSDATRSVVIGVTIGMAIALLVGAISVTVLNRKRILNVRAKRNNAPMNESTYDDLQNELRSKDAAYSGVSYDNSIASDDGRIYVNTIIQGSSDAVTDVTESASL